MVHCWRQAASSCSAKGWALNETRELKQAIKALFDTQRLAVLSTHDQEGPYGSLVAFAASDDLHDVLFATTRPTRKYRNLHADSRVALVIDSRSQDDADFHQAMAVTAIGTATELDNEEKDRLVHRYVSRHPHLKEFVTSPNCALFKITVNTFHIVRKFQQVMTLNVTH